MNFDAAIEYLRSEHIDSFSKFNEAIVTVIREQYKEINSQKTVDEINTLKVDELTLCFDKVLQNHLNEEQKQNLYEYFEFVDTVKPFFEKANEFNYLFELRRCVLGFIKSNHKPDFSFAMKDILTQDWSTFSKTKIQEMQEASQHSLISQDFCYSLSESFKIAPRIRASLFIYEVLKDSTYLIQIKNELFDSSSRDGRLLDGLTQVQDKDFDLLLKKIIQAKENHKSGKFQALEDLMNNSKVDLKQVKELMEQPDQDFKKTQCCSIM